MRKMLVGARKFHLPPTKSEEEDGRMMISDAVLDMLLYLLRIRINARKRPKNNNRDDLITNICFADR
jgi:hypothetical protein